MKRLLTPVLTFGLVLALAAPAFAQTTIRYKFKEGEKLNYVMDQKMKMSMTIMGNAIEMNMNQSAQMHWMVQSVDSDGNAKVQIKFGRVKMTMDMPMGKTEVDSEDANEPNDIIGKAMHGVVRALGTLEMTGKFSSRGEISDVVVPEKFGKALQGLPGADQFGDAFSPEGIKRMMSQSALVLPKEAISKGAKWKNNFMTKLPFGKIGNDIEYVYDGPTSQNGQNLEKFILQPKMTVESDPNAAFAMKLKSQENSGHALFDNAAGKLVNVTMNQIMELEVEVMGQTISQRIVQNVVTRLADSK